MKRTIAVLLACIMTLTLAACIHRHKIEHRVYTDDYPTLYQNELKEIFGDYTLGERKEQHVDGEEYCPHWTQDELDYYEWEITYRDACGQTMTRTMNNMHSFSYQQIEWLKDQIEEHFWTNYVVPYFGEWMEQGSIGIGSYCFCFIGRISASFYNEETYKYLEIGDQYWENLQNSTDLIPMHALSYPEIFDRYPIELCVNVRLSEDGVEEAEWPERFTTAKARLDQMVAKITEEIGSELNLYASVGRNRLDIDQSTRYYTVRILRGEQYIPGSVDGDFERAIMDSYKGKFW